MVNAKSATLSSVHLNGTAASPALFSLISRWWCTVLAVLLFGAQTAYAGDAPPICRVKVHYCYTDIGVKSVVARTYDGGDDVPFVAYDAKTLNLHDEKWMTCRHDSECQVAVEEGVGAACCQYTPCGAKQFVSIVRKSPNRNEYRYLFFYFFCRTTYNTTRYNGGNR